MERGPSSPAKQCAPRSDRSHHQADCSQRRPGPPAARCPWPRGSGRPPPAAGLTRAPRPRAARSSRPPPAASWPPRASRPRRTPSGPRPPGRPALRQRRGCRACSPPPANKSPGRDRAPRPALPIGPRTLLAGGVILPKVQPMPLGHPRTPESGRLGRKGEERLQQRDPHRRGPLLTSRGPPPLPPPQPAPCGPNQELKWRPRRGLGLRARARSRAPPPACLRGGRAGGRAGVVRARARRPAGRRRERQPLPLCDWPKRPAPWRAPPHPRGGRGLLPLPRIGAPV